MDHLFKPSPPFSAGQINYLAIAKATAATKIRIKQFQSIPLAGKVVTGPCMMTMPPFLLRRDVESQSRTHRAAGRVASG